MERLSAAQRSKIRRLSAPKEIDAADEGGELNIVPFLDIITNVLMFVLATVSVTFTATIDTFPPRAGSGARAPTTPTLGLTVILVPEGFSVKARGGNVSPGCNDTGPGIAIPAKGTVTDESGKSYVDYDYAALTVCANKLKNLSPDFKDETTVTISGNPNTPYQAIVATMDAVRKTTDEQGQDIELFPDVTFGVAR